MSENEPRPPQNPYGQPVPPSPHQSPHPSAGQSPEGRPDAPYGAPQDAPHEAPPAPYGYGQPTHQAPQSPYAAQPYGNDPYAVGRYGAHQPGDRRPGTVTAAGWIAIVCSALSTLFFGFMTLAFLVVQDPIVREMERQPEFRELDVDAGSIVGLLVAVMLVFALWSVIGIVLGVFVLKRSNVARILLVISSALVAVISLIGITSGVSAVTLAAAVAVIVLLFVGGASDWFARRSPASQSGGPYGGAPYGGSPYGA